MTMPSFALTDHLLALGLPQYEARVYITLAHRAAMAASEVAATARIPRQRAYDVLDSLEAKEMIVRHEGRPARFDAVDPKQAMARLTSSRRKVASQVAAQLQPLWINAHQTSDKSEDTHPQQITLAAAGQWRTSAKHSVLVTAHPPFSALADPSWTRRVAQLTDAGGTVRCVYHSDILHDPSLMAGAHRFAEAGEDARVTRHVPSRMILTDGRSALLPVPYPLESNTGTPMLLIEDPQVISELAESFESLWTQAVPLREAAAHRVRGPRTLAPR